MVIGRGGVGGGGTSVPRLSKSEGSGDGVFDRCMRSTSDSSDDSSSTGSLLAWNEANEEHHLPTPSSPALDRDTLTTLHLTAEMFVPENRSVTEIFVPGSKMFALNSWYFVSGTILSGKRFPGGVASGSCICLLACVALLPFSPFLMERN